LDEYGRVALTGQASRREGVAAGLDGRWFDGYAFRVGDESSRQVAVLFSETTARRQAEEQLRASEERFRTVADNVPQLIWTNDANGDANYFNKRFFDYTGLGEDALHGPGWQAVVHPDDAPRSIERWQQAFANGEVFDAEYRLRAADGSYRWFLGRNVPLRSNGEALSWFGTATDIDDFKQAQAKLATRRKNSASSSKARRITRCSCSIRKTTSPTGAPARSVSSNGRLKRRSAERLHDLHRRGSRER
jgi:PAS domain S-box-containing protein